MAVKKRSQRKAKKATVQRQPWLMPAILLLAVGALGSALSYGYHLLSEPGRLPLRIVEVNGDFQRLKRDEIERVVVQTINGGFFSCDMHRLREAVLAMPWVADVSIRRSWPDTLRMMVTEQVPLARWGEDALINVNGGVFRPAELDAFDRLVKLSGPQGSQQRVVAFFQAAAPAARANELQIVEVEQDQRRHWWLRFDQGLTVSLGREQIRHRLEEFLRVYPSLIRQPSRQPVRVDMRYAHGFAVRWRDVPMEEAAMNDVKPQEKV